MRILQVLLTYFAFWVYHKFIYYENKPIYNHMVAAHLMFSLTGLLWVPGNAEYWMVIPLLINCTRIEMYYHPHHTALYFMFHMMKNIPIWLNFHWAHSEGYSGAYVVSILAMDTIAWILHELRVAISPTTYTNYLTIPTLR